MRPSTFVSLAILLAAIPVIVLAQSSLPTQGVQLSTDNDVRFPANVSQCDRVLIYHNTPYSARLSMSTVSPSGSSIFITLFIPFGIGYLEWICNIPKGYTVIVQGDVYYVFVVQPGSSSCLGDVTTTYAYASYATTNFRSYTGLPPNTTAPSIPTNSTASLTMTFYTGSFTTITANPDLTVAPATSTPSRRLKSNKAAIVGGAVGAVSAVVISALAMALVLTCRRLRQLSNDRGMDGMNSQVPAQVVPVQQYGPFVAGNPLEQTPGGVPNTIGHVPIIY